MNSSGAEIQYVSIYDLYFINLYKLQLVLKRNNVSVFEKHLPEGLISNVTTNIHFMCINLARLNTHTITDTYSKQNHNWVYSNTEPRTLAANHTFTTFSSHLCIISVKFYHNFLLKGDRLICI